MMDLQKHIVRVALLLGLFAVVATTLVALTERNTREQIKENQRQALLNGINALIPHDKYNNDILKDTLLLPATEMLGTDKPTKVYRARQDGKPVAVVLTVIASNGYSGKIHMLVGLYHSGELAGVRVIEHKETPGLGDKIDAQKDDWILQFQGLSLENPPPSRWRVKKDGGEFDQFTGATITPRAVVGAVKKALDYFHNHRDELFAVTEEKT
ncbi:MAG: electron transport complex subunit RsxG [Methylophaga sp.]|jgi:H+/Na+-translocating ferredoxin:NAD+ oxidoreductase subunit G